jgi:hypothetical protein
MRFATTGAKKIISTQCRVMFDPHSGAIHHVHRVVTMDGAQESSEQEVEHRTRDLARSLGLDIEKLHMISVDPSDLVPGAKYKVDPKSHKLVLDPSKASVALPVERAGFPHQNIWLCNEKQLQKRQMMNSSSDAAGTDLAKLPVAPARYAANCRSLWRATSAWPAFLYDLVPARDPPVSEKLPPK